MQEYRSKGWLKNEYSKEELSIRKIAQFCNCDYKTIWKWLKKFNISIRSRGKGHYLAKTNHCNLSKEARQWIDGELLGDGCLQAYLNYSARITYSSKYEEYINYISNTLETFGIKQAGKIYKRYHKDMDCYSYQYISLCYAELLPIYKQWYPEGKKIIPRELKLTSLALRQEYIGDGSLVHFKNYRPRIVLYTNGFTILDVKWLVKQLNKLDFKTTRQPARNVIGISVHSTKDFLDYIGKSPVQCYQYKWNY